MRQTQCARCRTGQGQRVPKEKEVPGRVLEEVGMHGYREQGKALPGFQLYDLSFSLRIILYYLLFLPVQ